ncbi:SAM-dependent methyltransferase [Nonomuraea spiralis]|uniref:S-adenosyl-L-methionine-dependent methyltransferase n=1 Tax=Nonomuraea spiralis TaxID=46182 RepID=A0ABV5IMI4_9ACTN|nr:SAM-dependent methyltransferase [Nonomuraea spiralis]GGT00344.1 putative S-adenosyl-L-methionine-dependent methyltransferase [Nonomuraea spiralis]
MTQTRDLGVESGVGVTALMVAAARAIETHRSDSLAADPYAEHFVRAAAASVAWPTRPWEVPGGDADPLWGRLGRYFGLRTRVLDDFLLHAAATGVRQVVLLGAGLDTRAYRLPWPAGQVVHEVDRGGVLEFKDQVLGALAGDPCAPVPMAPAPRRRVVAADVGHDWAGPLLASGFDPAAPTAWLAEGLLLYLPPEVELRLLRTIDDLSAAGSVLAYEVKFGLGTFQSRANPVYAAAREQIGVDLLALFDRRPRPDSIGLLGKLRWHVTVRTPYDFARCHGRGPRPEPDDALATNRWVFAAKP